MAVVKTVIMSCHVTDFDNQLLFVIDRRMNSHTCDIEWCILSV